MLEYSDKLILGGDFNLYIDPTLDKDNYQNNCLNSQPLNSLLTEFNFIDIWRVKNPKPRYYTWRRKKTYYSVTVSVTFNNSKYKL